jgi:hypothetical protein
VAPVITQTVEWHEDGHLLAFAIRATSHGLAEDKARDRHESVFNQFSRNILGNSSAEVNEGDSKSDVQAPGADTLIVTGDMRIERADEPAPEQTIAFKPSTGNWRDPGL